MRIALDELLEVKEYYEAHYEEVHHYLLERRTLVSSVQEDMDFDGTFAESVKQKLYETGVADVDVYIRYILEIIHRFDRYITSFQDEVDDAPYARLDSTFFEATYDFSKKARESYESMYASCESMEREFFELHEYCGRASFQPFKEITELFSTCMYQCDTMLDRMYAFEQSYADYFADVMDGSFHLRLKEERMKNSSVMLRKEQRDATQFEHQEITMLQRIIFKKPKGMDDAMYQKYTSQLMAQLERLSMDGFDRAALKAYIDYTNTHVLYSSSPPRILYGYTEMHVPADEQLHKLFETYKEIGSPLFTMLFEASKQKPVKKLELVYDHYTTYKKWSSKLTPESSFFDMMNASINSSNLFASSPNQGSKEANIVEFYHYDMRHYLNEQGAFAPYEDYPNDQKRLQAMRADGWRLVNEGTQPEIIIQNSRYHAMLPEGYRDVNEFKLKHGYDPTKNVKLLSKDKKFERIYNVELGRFVDVEPYTVTPHNVSNYEQQDPFRNTANNMPTYNYGYPENHKKSDVEPFNKYHGSIKGITTDTTCYEGGFEELEKDSKKSKETCKEGIDLSNKDELERLNYGYKLGEQQYFDAQLDRNIDFSDAVQNFWNYVGGA